MRPEKFLNKIVIAVFAILFVAACTSGGGGNGNNNPTNETQQVTGTPTPTPAPTATPAPTPKPTATPTPRPTGKPGEFLSTGQIDETDAALFYNKSLGCIANGAPENKKQIDQRLRVGDKYRDTIYFGDPDKEYTLSLESTVQTVAARTSSHLGKVLKTNMPGVKVGQTSQTDCEVLSDTEGECSGSTSIGIDSLGFYLFIPNVLTGSVKTYEKGYYVLDDGFGVPAWRVVDEAAGFIADPMSFKIVGAGNQTVTTVHVPEIPSTALEFCGGVQAVTDTTVVTDGGIRVQHIGGILDGVKFK